MSNAEGEGKGSKPAANNSMVNAVAVFDKGGSLIYMGQSKGTITVLDAASFKFLDLVKVCFRPFLQAYSRCATYAADHITAKYVCAEGFTVVHPSTITARAWSRVTSVSASSLLNQLSLQKACTNVVLRYTNQECI